MRFFLAEKILRFTSACLYRLEAHQWFVRYVWEVPKWLQFIHVCTEVCEIWESLIGLGEWWKSFTFFCVLTRCKWNFYKFFENISCCKILFEVILDFHFSFWEAFVIFLDCKSTVKFCFQVLLLSDVSFIESWRTKLLDSLAIGLLAGTVGVTSPKNIVCIGYQ